MFRSKYQEMFPDEDEVISKEMYGKRKWKVIRSMSDAQLKKAFSDHQQFGTKIRQASNREEMMRILKRYSWAI